MPGEDSIAYRYRLLKPHLTDQQLRFWAAAEASVAGPSASGTLARITGIPETEIQRTQQQIKARAKADPTRSSS